MNTSSSSTQLVALLFVLSCVSAAKTTDMHNIHVTFQPNHLTDQPPDILRMTHAEMVKVQISFDTNRSWSSNESINIDYKSADETIATAFIISGIKTEPKLDCHRSRARPNRTLLYQCHDEKIFYVKGRLVGKTSIHVTIGKHQPKTIKYPVWVLRDSVAQQLVYAVSVVLLVGSVNVALGAHVRPDVMFQLVRRHPGTIALGLISHCLLMPVLSLLLAFHTFMSVPEPSLALALFAGGCAPTSAAANIWTVLLHGNVELSIVLTCLSLLCSLGLLPVYINNIGIHVIETYDIVHLPHTAEQRSINIPYHSILISTLLMVVPLGFGMLVRKCKDEWAENMSKALRPYLCVVLVFLISFGMWSNMYVFRLANTRVWIAGSVVPLIGFVLSGLVATCFSRSMPDTVTIAVTTVLQNTSVVIALLQATFDQPDSDFAATVPLVSALATPMPLLLAGLFRYLCCIDAKNESAASMRQSRLGSAGFSGSGGRHRSHSVDHEDIEDPEAGIVVDFDKVADQFETRGQSEMSEVTEPLSKDDSVMTKLRNLLSGTKTPTPCEV